MCKTVWQKDYDDEDDWQTNRKTVDEDRHEKQEDRRHVDGKHEDSRQATDRQALETDGQDRRQYSQSDNQSSTDND